jgi:hypothetical protein
MICKLFIFYIIYNYYMTTAQKKEVFDKLKTVVSRIIFDNRFLPSLKDTIKGTEFYDNFIAKFKRIESPFIRSGLVNNKDEIINLFDSIYRENTDDILMLAYAGEKDINVRTRDVIDFVINTSPEGSLKEYWDEYKRTNPSGGQRRRFRTKKRKTKKYKRVSKRNRKF